jgi:hypothetical protein
VTETIYIGLRGPDGKAKVLKNGDTKTASMIYEFLCVDVATGYGHQAEKETKA